MTQAWCVPQAEGGAIVFINAVQDRYALKSQSNSASLSMGVLGSVSLPVPVGTGDANLVKVDDALMEMIGAGRLRVRMSSGIALDSSRAGAQLLRAMTL